MDDRGCSSLEDFSAAEGSSDVKVLVACEFSGIVRDAFRDEGFCAVSCDFRESEREGPHIQGDVLRVLEERSEEFDLMVAHPPCTYLSNSGVRWLYENRNRWGKMIEGAVFFRRLLNADVPRVAVENPVIHKYARHVIGRGQDQVIEIPERGKTSRFSEGDTPRTPYATKSR